MVMVEYVIIRTMSTIATGRDADTHFTDAQVCRHFAVVGL
jgi:hypothetical protein